MTSSPAAERFRRELGERGWYAPTWPKEYGGGGLSVEHAIIIAEDLDRLKEVTPAVYDVGLSLASPALCVWGIEEQKQLHPCLAVRRSAIVAILGWSFAPPRRESVGGVDLES